jgi:glutathione S-transferase
VDQQANKGDRSLNSTTKCLKRLDRLRFLVGDSFTVADLLVATALGLIRRLNIAELPPDIVRYLDALEQRPAKQRSDARNPPSAAAS